jgi:hypothetical protein
MNDASDEAREVVETLIDGFLAANCLGLTGDPVLALQRLDRFLARFPAIGDMERRKIREAILGNLH